MNRAKTKYHIQVELPNGDSRVIQGVCNTFLFATHGDGDEENIAVIGAPPVTAAMLVSSLLRGLEEASPRAAEACLEALNEGIRPGVREVVMQKMED